jgi:L-ribulose-5-phosphate 3-epimerase UlaE
MPQIVVDGTGDLLFGAEITEKNTKVGSCSLCQCTHDKFRVGSNDGKKRARSSLRLAAARLPMTSGIHTNKPKLREMPLA